MRRRFKQALEGMLLAVAISTFYFAAPFLVFPVVVIGTDISFIEFFKRTQLGWALFGDDFWWLLASVVLFGAVMAFLIPPSEFRNRYLICYWWR